MKITFFVYISALFFLVTGWKLLCTGKLGYAGAVSAMKRQLFTRSRRKKAEAGIRVWMRRIPFFEHRRRAKIDAEISEGISFLRNLTVIGEGRRLSADSVIEQLADRRGMLSPVYGKMLRLLRQNQRGEAVDCFTRETDTEIGKDFGRLLIQWDELDPGNLLETLLSHQKSIKERRITEMKKRDEMISDLIYLPAVVNVVLIFINFIYVGYFISQRDLFETLLG